MHWELDRSPFVCLHLSKSLGPFYWDPCLELVYNFLGCFRVDSSGKTDSDDEKRGDAVKRDCRVLVEIRFRDFSSVFFRLISWCQRHY